MNTFHYVENVEYICKLIFETFRIPTFFLDKKGEIICEFADHSFWRPFYSTKKQVIDNLFNPNDPHQFPLIKTTDYLENFLSVCVKEEEAFKGIVLIGPTISIEPTEDMIKIILHDFNSKEYEEAIYYYQSLPIISSLKLLNAGMLLYYMIYQEKLELSDVLQQNKLSEENQKKTMFLNLNVSKRRQELMFHHDPLHEKKVFQCIKEGRKEELIKHLKLFIGKGEYGILSKFSQLRHQKNLAIAGITMATRYAMEGGLHPEIAYTLSDLYIQNLEELTLSKDVANLMEEALYDFADRVQKTVKQAYSKSINRCLDYIFTHLYEEITLSNLADLVSMNPKYLSSQFKKEVGIPLSEYIQRARVEEAKNLIIFTEHSLSEIYTLLNFHDQSYFTKIFKKYTGITPKEFSNKHFINESK